MASRYDQFSKMMRFFLFVIGLVSLGLGIVGAFLPLLPTTPFVIVAAWAFIRSSPRAHAWLYRQPYLGETLRRWEKNRSVSRKTKILAIGMIALSMGFMWLRIENLWIKSSVSVILIAVSIYLATRPED